VSLHSVPLTRDNLALCAPLWSDRLTYRDHEFADALAVAARLLDENRAFGAVILEGARARGFGMTVFVDDRCAAEYLVEPYAQFGRRLLLSHAASPAILDRHAIGAANAGRGLQLVVVNTNYDTTAREPDSVIGLIMNAFQVTHRGFHIARLINEVIGDHAVEVLERSRCFEMRRYFCDVGGIAGLRAAVGTLTRQQAIEWRNPLLAMFVYSPPRLRFTDAEQRLLRVALRGGTDDRLSEVLKIPVTAVKARWSRIQERAFARAPEIFCDLKVTSRARGRGAQNRHLILEYVRAHPSELTPFPKTGHELTAAGSSNA
jgi:hypothetical protein